MILHFDHLNIRLKHSLLGSYVSFLKIRVLIEEQYEARWFSENFYVYEDPNADLENICSIMFWSVFMASVKILTVNLTSRWLLETILFGWLPDKSSMELSPGKSFAKLWGYQWLWVFNCPNCHLCMFCLCIGLKKKVS